MQRRHNRVGGSASPERSSGGDGPPVVTLAAVLRGHTSCVVGVAFTAGGESLVSAATDGEGKLWDTATMAEATGVALPPGEKACRVAVSAASAAVVVCSDRGVVRAFSPRHARHLHRLHAHGGAVAALVPLASSSDGDNFGPFSSESAAPLTVATLAPSESVVKVWRLPGAQEGAGSAAASSEEVKVAPARGGAPGTHAKRVVAAVAAADGGVVATAGGGRVVVWRDGVAAVHVDMPGGGDVAAMALSSDLVVVATHGAPGYDVWRTCTGAWVGSWRPGDRKEPAADWRPGDGTTEPVAALAFSPNGRQLAVGGWDGLLVVLPMDGEVAGRRRGGGIVIDQAHDDWVVAVAWADDRMVASASCDGTVCVWRASTAPVVPGGDPPYDILARWQAFAPGTSWMRGLAFSPDGARLAVACRRAVLVCTVDGEVEDVIGDMTDVEEGEEEDGKDMQDDDDEKEDKKEKEEVAGKGGATPLSVAFANAGTLVVGTSDGAVTVYALEGCGSSGPLTHVQEAQFHAESAVTAVACSGLDATGGDVVAGDGVGAVYFLRLMAGDAAKAE